MMLGRNLKRRVLVRKQGVRKQGLEFLMVLGLCLGLVAMAPKVNALQDPQNGGPRANTMPGYSQARPEDDGAPDEQGPGGYPQPGGQQPQNPQQPSHPQGGGSGNDGTQFPAAQSEVARISLLHGEISMQRADTGDWSTAALNTPLVRGDQVATGDKSHAEIQLDYANILRLSSRSQAKIADLTRIRIQLQIAQGYASYSMFKGGEADVEIDTPNVAVRPLRTGRYRVQVNSDSETEVIVREGEAEVTTPQGSTTVKKGQKITVRGATNPEYRVDSAPAKDDWDRFNNDRDNEIRNSASWGRTNAYYTGASDLDANGRWIFIPGYGWVWQPYQQAAWAPYQSGRWVYEPYWGWTWVSYEPWGWAPYHYGRWFFWGSSWVWWPGPVYPHYRPIWAPAYVSFIGFGHGVAVGVGFGFGSIGWLPVGPHDYFYPWYGRGFNRVTVVNITNINVRNGGGFAPLAVRGSQPFVSNVNLALTNPRVRAGISGVPAGEFGRGTVEASRLHVGEGDLRDSRMVTGNVPVVPTRESLRVGGESRIEQGGLQPRNTDRFFTRNQPPPVAPAFHEQADQVQRVMQGHVGNAEISNTQASKANAGTSQIPSGGNHEAEGSRGTGNAGGPERSAGPVSSGSPQGNSGTHAANEKNTGGWSKFGSPSGKVNDSGHSNSAPSEGRTSDNRSSESRSSESRSGDSKSSDNRSGENKSGAGPSSAPASGPVDHGNAGWQHFPSNSGPGSRQNDTRQNDSRPSDNARPSRDRSSSSPNKPTLELKKPIVTPRESPSPTRGNSPPSSTPRGGSEPKGGGGHDHGGGSGGDKGSKNR